MVSQRRQFRASQECFNSMTDLAFGYGRRMFVRKTRGRLLRPGVAEAGMAENK